MGEVRKVKKITPIEKTGAVRKNPEDLEYISKNKKSDQEESFKDCLDKANDELDKQEMDLEATRKAMQERSEEDLYRFASKFGNGIDARILIKHLKEKSEQEKAKDEDRTKKNDAEQR